MKRLRFFTLFLLIFTLIWVLEAKRLKIAVAPLENKSSYPYSVSPLRDMLIDALFKTGMFDVYERERLDLLMEEKGLSQSGVVSQNYQQSFSGVDAILYGVVTQFGTKSTKKGGLAGTFKWGLLGGQKKDVVEVTLNLRLVDVNTGRILAVGKATSQKRIKKGAIIGLFKGVPVGWAKMGSDNTLIAQAVREVVEKAVTFVKNSLLRETKLESAKEKYLERLRARYPQIFNKEEKKEYPVEEERTFGSPHYNKGRVYLNFEVDGNTTDDISTLTKNVFIKELETRGFKITDKEKDSDFQIEGKVKEIMMPGVSILTYPTKDFHSVSAQIDLTIKRGSEIISALSYTLPQPVLHIQKEIAGRKAVERVAEITSSRAVELLEEKGAEYLVASQPAKKLNSKNKKVKVSPFILKVEEVTDFSSVLKVKNTLTSWNVRVELKEADMSKKQAEFKVYSKSSLYLAEKLASEGWKIERVNAKELVIKP